MKQIKNPGFTANDLFFFDTKKPGISLVSEMIKENNFELYSKREHETPQKKDVSNFEGRGIHKT